MKFIVLGILLVSGTVFAQRNGQFSTRINNKLEIGGMICKGGESIGDNGSTECKRGQWLISVDNINTCSDQGWCTELAAPFFVAELEVAPIMTIPEYSFHNIVPVSEVNDSIAKILNKYYVRFNMNGPTKVVPKK